MGALRRARAKSEQSFLEHIESILKALQFEVADIKTAVCCLNEHYLLTHGDDETSLPPPPPPSLEVIPRNCILAMRGHPRAQLQDDVVNEHDLPKCMYTSSLGMVPPELPDLEAARTTRTHIAWSPEGLAYIDEKIEQCDAVFGDLGINTYSGQAISDIVQASDRNIALQSIRIEDLDTEELSGILEKFLEHARGLVRDLSRNIIVWPPVAELSEDEGCEMLVNSCCAMTMEFVWDTLATTSLKLGDFQCQYFKAKITHVLNEELDDWKKAITSIS